MFLRVSVSAGMQMHYWVCNITAAATVQTMTHTGMHVVVARDTDGRHGSGLLSAV